MHALQSLFLLIWHVISSITIDARNSVCHSYWPASRGCSCCVVGPHSRLCGNKCLDLQRTVLERRQLLQSWHSCSFSVKIIIMGFFVLTETSSVLLERDSLE